MTLGSRTIGIHIGKRQRKLVEANTLSQTSIQASVWQQLWSWIDQQSWYGPRDHVFSKLPFRRGTRRRVSSATASTPPSRNHPLPSVCSPLDPAIPTLATVRFVSFPVGSVGSPHGEHLLVEWRRHRWSTCFPRAASILTHPRCESANALLKSATTHFNDTCHGLRKGFVKF